MTQLVMIVDDDPIQRRLLDAQVSKMGFRTLNCDGGQAAVEALTGRAGQEVDAVVLDLAMPDKNGIEVMNELRRAGFARPIVVQTARGSIDAVVEAMRAGAIDFVVKPASPEKLQKALAGAIRVAQSNEVEREQNRRVPAAEPAVAETYGASEALRPVLAQALKAADSAIPLLVEGETGVGKEWLARAVHAASKRARAPFVAVNCAALPGQLVESILFGHAKGAFTDAGDRHPGKFLEADGGTLFLDEIGEVPLDVQVKLLRVLQDGEVDPVGGRAPVRTNVRLVSATNRDLAAAVREGRFREDLFYRLNVLSVRVPPLRQRGAEIDDLARSFLGRFRRSEPGSPAKRFTSDALALLRAYSWPGNIRQLENAVRRAVVLADGEALTPDDFPQIADALIPNGELPEAADRGVAEARPAARAAQEGAKAERPTAGWRNAAGEIRRLEDVEADLIRMAVEQYGGRMSEIARRLGIGRSTLYRKLREYGIET